MQLTQHFALSEFTRSDTARRRGISNTPGEQDIRNLKHLCAEVLEPLRGFARQPICISSGYRCPALNRAVGGSPGSNHLTGCAADIRLPTLRTGRQWFQWLRRHVPFDELIWEHTSTGTTTWIHVALKPQGNRGNVITELVKQGDKIT